MEGISFMTERFETFTVLIAKIRCNIRKIKLQEMSEYHLKSPLPLTDKGIEVGGQYRTPHGLANAVRLLYELDAYGDCIHKKLHDLAIAAELSDANESHREVAEKSIQAVRDLNVRMKIDDKIKASKKKISPLWQKMRKKKLIRFIRFQSS